MKREEKNALSRQRILEAAIEEFASRGYEGASLNTVCADKGISKGIIYHHFKDKDELYLICVKQCFDAITQYLQKKEEKLTGSLQERLQGYFDARLRFFVDFPQYLGLFVDAALCPPQALLDRIMELRKEFDEWNISVLTGLLENEPLRPGFTIGTVAEDFRMYMDYFHIHFKSALRREYPVEEILKEHEERCHRQVDILLHGVLGEKIEN